MISHFVAAKDLPWRPSRFPGVETKSLFFDAQTGMATVLTRLAPGAKLPDHEHVLVEQTYVLEGELHDRDGVARAGEFVWRPAGSRHEAWTPTGCMTLAIFQIPNRFYAEDGSVADFENNPWEARWAETLAARSG
ncbi:MAG: cupin [Tagaea sp. CACIAM 22H2]|nr:cupin [Tagaea sp. CACIAM 22H2]